MSTCGHILESSCAVIVSREKFLEACSFASFGLGKQGIGTCFKFSNGHVSAFNEDTYASAPIDIGWSGIIEASKLLGILQKNKDESVDIVFLDKKQKLVLKGSGKAWKSEFVVEIHESLGEWEIEEPDEWLHLDPHMLDGIAAVQSAADKGKKSTPMTRCIHITPTFIEATDTSQYARYTVDTGFANDVLVLRDGLKTVVPVGAIEFAVRPEFIHFRNQKGVRISVRTEMGDYPDLGALLDGIEDYPELPLPGGMKEALDACGVMLGSDVSEHAVLVTLKPGWLYCESESSGNTHTTRSPLPSYVGEELQFSVHPKLLGAIVEHGKMACAPLNVHMNRLVVCEGRHTYMVIATTPTSEDADGLGDSNGEE